MWHVKNELTCAKAWLKIMVKRKQLWDSEKNIGLLEFYKWDRTVFPARLLQTNVLYCIISQKKAELILSPLQSPEVYRRVGNFMPFRQHPVPIGSFHTFKASSFQIRLCIISQLGLGITRGFLFWGSLSTVLRTFVILPLRYLFHLRHSLVTTILIETLWSWVRAT